MFPSGSLDPALLKAQSNPVQLAAQVACGAWLGGVEPAGTPRTSPCCCHVTADGIVTAVKGTVAVPVQSIRCSALSSLAVKNSVLVPCRVGSGARNMPLTRE